MRVLHSTTLPRSNLHRNHHSFPLLQGLSTESTIKTSVYRAFCPCSHSLETGNCMAVEESQTQLQICSASPLQVLPSSALPPFSWPAVPRCIGHLPILPAGTCISSPEHPAHCSQPRSLLPAPTSGHSWWPQPVPTPTNKDIMT